MAEVLTTVGDLSIENGTTRALVKKQMEEFSQIYYQIEINKYNIDRLEKKTDLNH